jgi:nucleoside phosphorylase
MSTTVLILTPLTLEKNAVIEFLENVTPLRDLKARAFKGSYSFKGKQLEVKGKQLEVVVMETGPTIANATDATTEGIIVLKPKIVVLSGIAGAISDDLQLLDVAIGTSAMDYTYAAEKDNETEYRTNVINYDYDLVKIAKDVSENSLWKERVKTSGGERSTAIEGIIASGNTVLKSYRGATYLFLKKSKVLAVEMESHGFATALQGRSIPAINIRAISDLVKDKEASDKHGNQFLAAKIAATFVFCFLEEWYARLENTSTEDDEKKTEQTLSNPQPVDKASVTKEKTIVTIVMREQIEAIKSFIREVETRANFIATLSEAEQFFKDNERVVRQINNIRVAYQNNANEANFEVQRQAFTALMKEQIEGLEKKTGPREDQERIKPNMPQQQTVFVVYSRQDIEHKNTLVTHLDPLVRNGRINIWADHDIKPGEEWDAAIRRNLAASNIILILVSAQALASDYINDVELEAAYRRHQNGTVAVIPILLRPCSWQETWLIHLQALPRNGNAITTHPNTDAAWTAIVEEIRVMI